MVLASNVYGTGGVVPNGTPNIALLALNTNGSTDNTIFNRTGKGTVTAIAFSPIIGVNAAVSFGTLTVTIDGGSPIAVMSGTFTFQRTGSTTTANEATVIPLGIKYNTSLTITVRVNDGISGAGSMQAAVINYQE